LEAGVKQCHFETISRRWVAGNHGIDVFAQILEHLTAYHAMIAGSFRPALMRGRRLFVGEALNLVGEALISGYSLPD
jgi:hypothetical protein